MEDKEMYKISSDEIPDELNENELESEVLEDE